MKKSDYKAVLFDLDGTLVDSMEDIASAINRVLGDFELAPQGVDSYRNRVGWGLRKALELTMPPMDSEEINRAVTLLKDYYTADPCTGTTAYDGIHNLLETLKSNDCTLFVYTNKDESIAEIIIENVFPTGTFKKIFGARSGRAQKPDKTAVRSVIEETGFKAEEILYIGDSEVDMETAAAGNMDSLAVLWGYRDKKQLEEYKKLAYVNTPDEIAGWII